MEQDNKAVETNQGTEAATEPTELEKKLAEKDTEIARIAKERDNYKRGMLKAKGKLPDEEDGDDEESVDDKVTRIVNERLLDAAYAKANAEKDEIIRQTLARNKELETVIKNRSQIATTDQGSGSETKLNPKDPILSEEKLKQLKAMGWDDAKIERYKANLMKVK